MAYSLFFQRHTSSIEAKSLPVRCTQNVLVKMLKYNKSEAESKGYIDAFDTERTMFVEVAFS